jgi:hypothetical protein
MPRKGRISPPEDKAIAAAKAMRIYSRARARIAFFFIGGKLFGCQADKSVFERRVQKFEATLVGIYDINRDYREVLDDLDAYYKQFSDLAVPELIT